MKEILKNSSTRGKKLLIGSGLFHFGSVKDNAIGVDAPVNIRAGAGAGWVNHLLTTVQRLVVLDTLELCIILRWRQQAGQDGTTRDKDLRVSILSLPTNIRHATWHALRTF
jgi:hypothetical protein